MTTPASSKPSWGYAVAADAEAQLAAALEAAGTVAATLAAGLAAFDAGLWRPNLLIVAPGSLLDVAPYTSVLEAVGIEIVAVPGVTVGVLADRTAVNGWLSPIAVVATEPSLLGKSVARAIFGRVGATAAGVQVLTAIAA